MPASRILESLTERARHFYIKRKTQALREELNYNGIGDLDTIQTIASIRALVAEPIDTIIDVGAHLGVFARPAAEILQARQVICYEPSSNLQTELAQNLQGIRHEIRDVALSNQEGHADFYVHPDESMNSLAKTDRNILSKHFATYDHDGISKTRIRTTTLDSEAQLLTFPNNGILIKIDTQGTELEVLEGARRLLPRVTAILIEYMFTSPYSEQRTFLDVTNSLADMGFRCGGALNRFLKATHVVSGVDLLFLKVE